MEMAGLSSEVMAAGVQPAHIAHADAVVVVAFDMRSLTPNIPTPTQRISATYLRDKCHFSMR